LGRSTLSDHVSRVIASSRFFRRHYIAFTSDSEPEAAYRTKESLEMLKVPAVGVIWFRHKGEEAVLLKPACRPQTAAIGFTKSANWATGSSRARILPAKFRLPTTKVAETDSGLASAALCIRADPWIATSPAAIQPE
jgi:hypothetical protein